MRDLALKVLPGGFIAAFDIANQLSGQKAVPFACELLGVVINISAVPTNIHSADVLINDASTTVEVVFPAATTKGFFAPDVRVFLQAGDRVRLRSNGENAAPDAYDATFAYIFTPLSPRPAGEIWLDGQSFADIAAAGTSATSKCVPLACELKGVALSIAVATNGAVNLNIIVDNVATTSDILLPNPTTRGYFALDEVVHLKEGAQVGIITDGQGTAGGQAFVTYVLSPITSKIPAGWEYMTFIGVLAFQTPAAEFQPVVAPCAGKVRNLVTHWSVAINTTPNTGNTFDLKINGVNPPNTPIYRNVEDPLAQAGVSAPIENLHDAFVEAGDLITVETNGEQVAAVANGIGGIWIEPMGQVAGGGP